MTTKKKRQSKRPTLLSSSRLPTLRAKQPALSARATRTLIRTHHRLLKQRAQALHAGNQDLVAEIDAKIQENGGLESYQLASKLGQSSERGGDSSKVLVDWITPKFSSVGDTVCKLRVLEVGALSTQNAISKSQFLDVTRIDLNSQEPGILKQDFMQRPLPRNNDDRFNLISLSLVLNFVPDAAGRGEMLQRCVMFLTDELPPNCPVSFHPLLFLVLPAACVDNSRYLDEDRLAAIMSSLGFALFRSKKTSKLIYQLWELSGQPSRRSFKKELLNPGGSRNNFAIVIRT